MRLSISNIAWDVSEDGEIAKLLNRYGINAIDIAPGKYFPNPTEATDVEIARIKRWWNERGIEIIGMQALLFGTTGLNVFGSPHAQSAMLQHLAAVCRIAAGLGAKKLVFGSPKNRDRAGLGDKEASDIAVHFFRQLGEIALINNVMICLEPNPPRYGANFMTTSAETAQVVANIAHPAIRMQLDTGALAINGEDVETAIQDNKMLIGHIHASEPDLVPLGDGDTDHARFAAKIKQHLPELIVTIEMVATKVEEHSISIERALRKAIKHYRDRESE